MYSLPPSPPHILSLSLTRFPSFSSLSLSNPSAPFYKILVPTVDTLRYDFLVHSLISHGRPVLLVGPVGTGKTSVAQGVLQKLDPLQYNLLTINLSARVGPCNIDVLIGFQIVCWYIHG